MASPVIETTNTTNGSAATTSAVVNMPTGIVAGDLLIVLHRSAIGTVVHSDGSGLWTNLFNSDADASDDRISLWYKQAAGGDSLTITQSSSKFASLAWRISGAENPATQAPEFATLATATSATPDPGAITPTGGSKDYLFLWMGGWEGEQTSPPASNPTNYTANVIGADSGTGGAITTNCRCASAARSLTTAGPEDPGSWTISVSDDWTATVVAVHPAPPAAPSNPVIGFRTTAAQGYEWPEHRSTLRMRPQFYPFPYGGEFAPPAPANPIIPILTPSWRQWDWPERRSYAWHYGKYQSPRYFPLIIYQETFSPYEAFLQFDATQYTPGATVYFEAILKSSSGAEVKARLFNITDGVEVTGSGVTTTSTSDTRVRSGAITLTGTKEYRAEVRQTGGVTTTAKAARLIVQQ